MVPKVTFSDSRQASLASASSEISLPEAQLDWAEYLDIDGEKILLRKKFPTSCESVEEGSGLELAHDQAATSSPFQGGGGAAQQSSIAQKTQEPNVDLELDVKVFINSGKCVLHTKDPREDELKL